MVSLRCTQFLAVVFLASVSSLMAQTTDIYFIAGQSNAGNLGEINSYDVQGYNGYNAASFNNQTNAGFNLSFARIRDRNDTRTDDAVTDVVEQFSFESDLDPTNYAVDNIAVQLNGAFGNDVGIFSYGRNGRSLASTTGSEDWFPGTVAAPDNSELYGSFLNWSADRIAEVERGIDGILGTPDDQEAVVQGIMWFQGETDSSSTTSRAAYEDNFTNLVARFRDDFGNEDLVVVASEIRDLNANDAAINTALNTVAATDPNVEVININTTNPDGSPVYSPVSANDVHLNANGFLDVSNDFAQRLIQIQSANAIPEPSSALLLAVGGVVIGCRRRRSNMLTS